MYPRSELIQSLNNTVCCIFGKIWKKFEEFKVKKKKLSLIRDQRMLNQVGLRYLNIMSGVAWGKKTFGVK